jgi:uncharacterized protein (DUF2345 family)
MAAIIIASAMLIVGMTSLSQIARQQQGYSPSTAAQKQTSQQQQQQQQLDKENLCLSTGKCSLWIY